MYLLDAVSKYLMQAWVDVLKRDHSAGVLAQCLAVTAGRGRGSVIVGWRL